jgi:3-phosphoshikimate 1-carboxyvinyltransferase
LGLWSNRCVLTKTHLTTYHYRLDGSFTMVTGSYPVKNLTGSPMNLPAVLEIPVSAPVDGVVRVPGSKSISNRALVIAALARGTSTIKGVLHSDDTHHMAAAWRLLGVPVVFDPDGVTVQGCDGRPFSCEERLYVGNAGTAARFLTAVLTLGRGTYRLSGNQRMQQRPIADLLQALNQIGGRVRDVDGTGCPPIEIQATGLQGGTVQISGRKSSQYVSALMMAAPYAVDPTIIDITGELVSRGYVELTRSVMAAFGGQTDWIAPQTIRVAPQRRYRSCDYVIEGDASSASYFFAMAAITGGRIKVHGIDRTSQQGDLGLLEILGRMGCEIVWESDGVVVTGGRLQAVTVDMNAMSDVAPTLAAVTLFADGESRILNVGNMRIKECDRIRAMVTELGKLGALTGEWADGFSISGSGVFRPALLNTYDDHRMAMALSLTGLRIPGVSIAQPSCVSKTFPNFYDLFLPLIRS